jgi:hypothetical protein
LWGALSDERTGLTFIYAAGPYQRNFSLVRAPWVSRPYFTVSHLRLPFLSPPTTRRVTEPLIIIRHGPHRKHPPQLSELLCNLATSCSKAHGEHSSHCCVFAGTCLSSRCLETGCIAPLFYCCVLVLLSNGCFCDSTILAWRKYAAIVYFASLIMPAAS